MNQITFQSVKTNNPFFEWAFVKDINLLTSQLKSIAIFEEWDYSVKDPNKPLPILRNYLLHTFTRLKEECKVIEKGLYACFNTGLITENQEQIFALFKKFEPSQKWVFVQFCRESDTNLNRFSPLPERAEYFTDTSQLTYDTRLQLRINIDHIINDQANFARFPKEMQSSSKHYITNTFNGAIEHAKIRLKRNYKTAIPQYYRGKYTPNGQLQLLLPLCFNDPKKADLALAVYKVSQDGEDFYSGRTCLTLDMAINNARLICKPDDEWLKP